MDKEKGWKERRDGKGDVPTPFITLNAAVHYQALYCCDKTPEVMNFRLKGDFPYGSRGTNLWGQEVHGGLWLFMSE